MKVIKTIAKGMLTVLLFTMLLPGMVTRAAGMEEVNQFPVSYRESLMKLKEEHPQWSFVPMQVDVEWETAIQSEMVGSRSLVSSVKPAAWKGEQHSPGWYYATKQAVEYCMDPRNFLNEAYIFMFEQLTYDSKVHSLEGVQKILQGSFMAGAIPDEEDGTTYAELFYRIGNNLKVSPYHLACRVYQEQGANGTSPLISGEYPGYEGYYNFFNIKASGNTNEEVITSGLAYAKKMDWNTRSLAIDGGSKFVSQSYILKNQDTLYLQKFDVDPTFQGMFVHQYMQNISAPTSEGLNMRKTYESVGALDNEFVFKIPVYRNMPGEASPQPVTPTKPSEELTPEQLTKNFVKRLYELALGRDIYSEAEIQDWYDKLASGEKTGAEVARGFFFSKEFKDKKLSNEDYIKVLYRVMFNREADQGGFDGWMRDLERGMTREFVYAGFANAAEFTKVCETFDIKRGSIVLTAYRDKNRNLTAFITRLYEKVLGRKGDDGGLENWCKAILTKTKTAEEVSYGFVYSPEFLKKNTTDAEYVKIMYNTFLDREPDQAGFTDWVNRLSKGTDRMEIFKGFVRSREYQQLLKDYGIN